MIEQEKSTIEINSKFTSRVKKEAKMAKIDADGLHYKDLNQILRALVNGKENSVEKIDIQNVIGQRYLGTDLHSTVQIDVHGTPGNDLAAFMSGPTLVIHGSAQDGCGNTMDEGKIIIHGHAGDVTGHSMRGGKVFVKDYVGCRVGIHMKEYKKKIPKIIIGQTAGDFLAEYMAGGIILLLGLNLKEGERCNARFVGTGMHGGVIYERGDILTTENGTKISDVNKRDLRMIEELVKEYCGYFNMDANEILKAKFKKVLPISSRPYAKLYSH